MPKRGERNLSTSVILTIIPGVACIGGVFLFNLGIVGAIVLYNLGLAVSISLLRSVDLDRGEAPNVPAPKTVAILTSLIIHAAAKMGTYICLAGLTHQTDA